MRQVYRVAGADLQLNTLAVSLSLNRSERPARAATYLAQLGLSIPTDPGVFDRENRSFRVREIRPRRSGAERFLIFPHLEPFSEAARLTTGRAVRLAVPHRASSPALPGPARALPVPAALRCRRRQRRSTLSLDALQIKEGSDQLSVGGRPLLRGTDYTIDYSTGLVTFLDPAGLFGNAGGQVTARFEQQDLFAWQPTTILGSPRDTRWRARVGEPHRRPAARATAYNGRSWARVEGEHGGRFTTDLHFQSLGLTRLLDRSPPPPVAPSRLDLNAELALSRPDRTGRDRHTSRSSSRTSACRFRLRSSRGNSAASRRAPSGSIAARVRTAFDPDDAVALTWQNLIPGCEQPAAPAPTAGHRHDDRDCGPRRSLRDRDVPHAPLRHRGRVREADNSSQWTLPTRPARTRWRSMVTTLSPPASTSHVGVPGVLRLQSGLRAADSAGVQLIFDLGTVNGCPRHRAEALALVGTDSLSRAPVRRPGTSRQRACRRRNLQRARRRHRHPRRPARLLSIEEQIIRDPALCGASSPGRAGLPWAT